MRIYKYIIIIYLFSFFFITQIFRLIIAVFFNFKK
jgi:hypothetical protein